MVKLLLELLNAFGVSGAEHEVRDIISREIKNKVDELKVDKFGSLIARVKGKGPKVMLAAHMDEVGLMVRKIDPDGHIHFVAVGGIEPTTLVGQAVHMLVKGGKVKGIITLPEIHDDTEMENLPEMKDLYVDTGLDSKQLEKLGVGIGTYILPTHYSGYLGSQDIISGKALDDRAGCYAMIEIIKRLKKVPLDLYFVFTVQEEVGLYGAKLSVYQINPDWGVAVETTSAIDAHQKDKITVMGNGPCLILKDAELITNRCLNDHIIEVAKKKDIPLQLCVDNIGTTDATNIALSKDGIPSTVVSVAIRNIHSTVSIAHMRDIEDMIVLLMETLKKPPKVCLV
jgi:tetrahedral aminopeptidase